MNFDIQSLLLGVILVAAVIYLFRTLRRNSQGHACEGSACKCEPTKVKKV